jgi:hypothetical protein
MKKRPVVAMLLVLGASFGAAQTPKNPVRVFAIKGSVVDIRGRPAGLALVYLKESHSRMLRIKRADHDGHFAFTRLSRQFDYQIYAEQEDMASETALVSQSQETPEVTVNLKLTRKGQ